MSKIIFQRMMAVLILLLFINIPAFAQDEVVVEVISETSVFQSALFWILLIGIIVLLLVIITIGGVMIGLVENKIKNPGKLGKGLSILVFFILGTVSANASNGSTLPKTTLDNSTLSIMCVVILIELLVILYLYYMIRKVMVTLEYEKAKEKKPLWSSFIKKMTASVPVEQEELVATDHSYDGIIELDNDLPPWWVYMFYLTIVFSVVYIFYYHFGSGKLQLQEYETELVVAAEKKEQYLKNAANLIDENNVIFVTEQKELDAGKKLFQEKCAACHGQLGEGGVGPNLVDEYWLHGGSIKSIFKTIKYGVQEKGMIAWQGQLQPKEIQEITSYIYSIKGTKPANAKAPQGELFVEEVKTDSVSDNTDSSTVALK